MTVLTVAGLVVAALIVVAVVIAAHRGRSTSASATPVDGTALGGVPGYMPGMSPTVERRQSVTTSRVDPPDAAAGVDLEGNLARLRRDP